MTAAQSDGLSRDAATRTPYAPPSGRTMFLYRSNRSEKLVDELAEVLRRPQSSPFAPELIVVQSKGMERWLAMELSQRLGVFANAQFPFPRHLLERLFDSVLGDPPEMTAGFGEAAMMWAIAALLPERLGEEAFAPIASYLGGDTDGTLRIQLAQRIARVFDDYTVYRPELLSAWENGQEHGWDACSWRTLVERLGRGHQAARAERFIEAIRHGTRERAMLPERLCLFGISSLPPLYSSVLSALAERVETHLFVLSPSREYWGDIRKRRTTRGDSLPERHGHPLLASLGRLGREFQEVLEERTQYAESDRELYVDPGTDNLLHTLQSDILHLRNRGGTGDAAPRLPIAADDSSISVHVCHGPMREVEVLHDQLVSLLEDPRLAPHEIVVMTPDIETYAPVIEAVFGQRGGRPQLPYSVADRKTRTTHEVVDALYALLDVLQGRMTASQLLDLLSLDCIRRRFAIASEEIETLRGFIEQSGVRWGVDEAHRAEVGQPALTDNTFRLGLTRMLLGYAMPGRGKDLYAGVLPFDAVEGSAGELLGKLCELCERLFEHRLSLAAPRPLRAWRDDLLALIEQLVDAGPTAAHEQQMLRAALSTLVEGSETAGFAEPLGLRSVLPQLERVLDERLPARGLLDRGITFCQLVPMRSIPFQVVCLIGMNDDSFPGKSSLLGFDRMADKGARRVGDRSRRDDDRYMFLEALLSARQRVIISYVGRGIHDNRVLPPSVVVGELLDAIEQGFSTSTTPLPEHSRRAALERRLCVDHHLHAFSPAYFRHADESRLFSYASHHCEGARALDRPRRNPRLLEGELPATEELSELTIEELVAWVTRPIRTFMQQKLGLYLGQDIEPIDDREPLDLDQLARWRLGTDLIDLVLDGVALPALLPAVRGRGVLPLGTPGTLVYAGLAPEVVALAQAAMRHRRGKKLDPLAIELTLDGVRLTGTLRQLWPDAHLNVSYSKFGKRFELGHFIEHVVLCYALSKDARPGYPTRSVVIAREQDAIAEVHFEPIGEPEGVLRALLGVVRAARTRGLPFEYEVARPYADALLNSGGNSDRALSEARHAFDAQHDKAYIQLLYPTFDELIRDDGPLGFVALTATVLGPFLQHRSRA